MLFPFSLDWGYTMNFRTLTAVVAVSLGAVAISAAALQQHGQDARGADRPQWSLNATAIEACSCPMFCQCYFNTEPASHGGGHGRQDDGHADEDDRAAHYCLFNMAWKVNRGHAGDTDLAGAKFWISGDLGDEFSDGELEWAHLRFDPEVTKAQREGIVAALPRLFPAKWKSFTVGQDAPIEWKADTQRAEAKLDGGDAAEITLNRVSQRMEDEPVVITNLVYWGAPRNDGFVLMKTERHATRETPEGIEPFEFRDSNGFMITVDINADDAAGGEAAAAAHEEGKGH